VSYYTYPAAGMYGDPGFFGAIGRVFKGIGKVAAGVAGIPLPGGKPKALPGGSVVGGGIMQKMQAISPRVGSIIKKLPKGAIGAAGAAAGAVAGGLIVDQFGNVVGRRKRRRLNVTNVKALRRSIRRCTGFAKLAKRVLRFTSPRPPRGRVTFRKRSRKRVA
jgi:hypothetical protein